MRPLILTHINHVYAHEYSVAYVFTYISAGAHAYNHGPVYACDYTYKFVDADVHAYAYTYLYVYTHMGTYIYAGVYDDSCTCTYVHILLCRYACLASLGIRNNLCANTVVYAYTCNYTYTYVYT